MKKRLYLILLSVLLVSCMFSSCSDESKIAFEKLDDINNDNQSGDVSDQDNSDSQTSEQEIKNIGFTAEIASEEFLSITKKYHTYKEDGAEYPQVLYKTSETVTNLEIFQLSVTENGDLQKGKVLYTLQKLSPDKPLVAETCIDGDTPVRGISFEDADGNIHCYSVSKNKKDGSVKLSEIDFNEVDSDTSKNQ